VTAELRQGAEPVTDKVVSDDDHVDEGEQRRELNEGLHRRRAEHSFLPLNSTIVFRVMTTDPGSLAPILQIDDGDVLVGEGRKREAPETGGGRVARKALSADSFEGGSGSDRRAGFHVRPDVDPVMERAERVGTKLLCRDPSPECRRTSEWS
jgi:hypothetical protein